jgi:LysR family glycine cleavage system transcriptional activator
MRRLPPLSAVQTFEAAARHLSFQRAAEELHVTASAISHQVHALEEFLGVRLFKRLARQVVLTPEGQAYLPPVRAALDQINAATERIAASRDEGPLTMGVAPPFATGWLVPRLTGFQRAHPDIEVRLSLVPSTQVVDFANSDMDLLIRFVETEPQGVRNHRLIAEELVPVCSPALLKRVGLQRPEDLRNVTRLHVLPRLSRWRRWFNVAGVTEPNPERGPKFQNTPLALEAALAGLGVAIADRHFVAGEVATGRLIVPFDIPLPGQGAYYLIYPEERADIPKVAAFRDWILHEVSERNLPEAAGQNR